jgi:hypothetical protein
VVKLTRRRAGKRKAKKKKAYFTQRQQISNPPTAEKSSHRRFSKKTLIIAVVSVIIILLTCVFWISWPFASQQTQDGANANVPRAAILDGLYDKSPNETLIENIAQYLSNAGYTVDVYRGVNVTIDLLRDVGGYKLLILRLHSAVHTDNFLYVFSGEEYTESKYVDEQLAGAVRKAYTFNESEPPYFALNSVFIGKRNPKGLNGTTLIMGGCNGTAKPYVIQRFFQEGVKVYISWDGYVNLPHSDEATLRLVKAMCVEGLSSEAAVEKVKREVGPDPTYGSQLLCALP